MEDEENWYAEGRGPGEHVGRYLFGMAAGVPLTEVFSDNDGGGVEGDF